jgi:hypothetical protein
MDSGGSPKDEDEYATDWNMVFLRRCHWGGHAHRSFGDHLGVFCAAFRRRLKESARVSSNLIRAAAGPQPSSVRVSQKKFAVALERMADSILQSVDLRSLGEETFAFDPATVIKGSRFGAS